MVNNMMELNLEQMEYIIGAHVLIGEDAGCSSKCRHLNKVKTPWWGREDDYIFWTRHQNAYLCPDCVIAGFV